MVTLHWLLGLKYFLSLNWELSQNSVDNSRKMKAENSGFCELLDENLKYLSIFELIFHLIDLTVPFVFWIY